MTTVMRGRMPGMTGEAGSMAQRLAGAGVLAGLLGGLAMIVVMILVMGAAGMGMHLPAATVTQVGALMSGHATNAQVAGLMSMLSPSVRSTVMSAVPVSASHMLVGTVLHFAYAGFLGVVFAMVIAAAMMMRVPLMAFVPQAAFFLSHLLYGLVAAAVLAVSFRRCGMIGASAREGQA